MRFIAKRGAVSPSVGDRSLGRGYGEFVGGCLGVGWDGMGW